MQTPLSSPSYQAVPERADTREREEFMISKFEGSQTENKLCSSGYENFKRSQAEQRSIGPAIILFITASLIETLGGTTLKRLYVFRIHIRGNH